MVFSCTQWITCCTVSQCQCRVPSGGNTCGYLALLSVQLEALGYAVSWDQNKCCFVIVGRWHHCQWRSRAPCSAVSCRFKHLALLLVAVGHIRLCCQSRSQQVRVFVSVCRGHAVHCQWRSGAPCFAVSCSIWRALCFTVSGSGEYIILWSVIQGQVVLL